MQNPLESSDFDFITHLQMYVTDAKYGRDHIVHWLILNEAPANQQKLFATFEHATQPMYARIRAADGSRIYLEDKVQLALKARDLTLPTLKELGIELPAQRRNALRDDYERFFEFLLEVAENKGGTRDLAVLRARPSEDDPHGPWNEALRRKAYIEWLRHGGDISDERFREVFPGWSRRARRLTDLQLAKLLGLSFVAFKSLFEMRPSPAALNELCKVTGYLDLSIFRRKSEAEGEVIAALMSGGSRIRATDYEMLEWDAQFDVLERKSKRMRRDE